MAVEWSRLSGEQVEELVATLLGREFTEATLMRPSQGDGGIDVFVPLLTGGYAVYQVKKFPENLTGSQRGQSVDSFQRLLAYREETGFDVREWYLTMPLNPTETNRDWFANFTADVDIDCQWRGRTFLDGLAAKYPDVVDYLLEGGATRLAAVVSQMTTLLKAQASRTADTVDGAGDGSGVLTPAQAMAELEAMRPLLDSDPHFRYAISLDIGVPDPTMMGTGHLLALTKGSTDPTAESVTVKIYPRFRAATALRPIPMNVTFNAVPGTQFAADLAAFRKYGSPLTTPEGVVDFTGDLPGGLGGTFTGGTATIGPVQSSPGPKGPVRRLSAVAPDGSTVGSVLLDMEPVSVGPDGSGGREVGADRAGVLNVEILADFDTGRAKFNVTLRSADNRPPDEVLPTLRLLALLRAPNSLRFGEPFATTVGESTDADIDLSSDWLNFDGLAFVIDVYESLAALQPYAPFEVVIPPPSQMSPAVLEAWSIARRLLEGQSVPQPGMTITLHMNPGATPPLDQVAPIDATSTLSVMVGDQSRDLGTCVTHIDAASIDPDSARPHGDHVDYLVRPAEGHVAVTHRLETPPTAL